MSSAYKLIVPTGYFWDWFGPSERGTKQINMIWSVLYHCATEGGPFGDEILLLIEVTVYVSYAQEPTRPIYGRGNESILYHTLVHLLYKPRHSWLTHRTQELTLAWPQCTCSGNWYAWENDIRWKLIFMQCEVQGAWRSAPADHGNGGNMQPCRLWGDGMQNLNIYSCEWISYRQQ